jgi:hypothetical protein
MEFLRRKIILLIFTAVGFSAVAQVSQEALEAAFNKSYQLEKAGDFSAAADVLKKVFDESSYELNLVYRPINRHLLRIKQMVIS